MVIDVDVVQSLALAIFETADALDEVTNAGAEACVSAALENLIAALSWETAPAEKETPND